MKTVVRLTSLWLVTLLWLTQLPLRAQSRAGSGNCLTFNGFSTFINCGTADRGVTQRVTLEAWIKTSSYANQWVLGKYSNQFGEEKGYCLATWNGKAIGAGRARTGNYLTTGYSTTRVDDNRWHHVAAVIDNNVWKIYVDGILESSVTHPFSTGDLTNSQPLGIGDYYDGRSRPFQGEIDEIKIWRTARTTAQIQESMCHKFAVAPPDLIAYYRFDQTTRLTSADNGSQPTNGTLSGFVNAPWHLSGAPLGDRSAYAYRTGSSLGTISLTTTAGDTVRATGFSAQLPGAHLYVVDSPPSPAVPAGGNAYFGVYTLSSNASYIAELRPAGCRSLFRRADNSLPPWLPAPLIMRPHAVAATGIYRAEYAWAAGGAAVPPVITGNPAICPGQATTLTAVAAGAAFQWNTGATTASITVTQPGSYSVRATYAGNCASQSVFNVTAAIAPLPFSLGPDTSICAGTPLVLAVATQPVGSIYRWQNGSSASTFRVTASGRYILNVTNAAGCSKSDTVNVQVRPLPLVELGPDRLICTDTQVVLSIAAQPANTTYRWQDGSSAPTYRAIASGRYTVSVTNAAGCAASDTVNVLLIPLPEIDLGPDRTICGGNELVLSAQTQRLGATYRWQDGSTAATYRVTAAGRYTIEVSVPPACIAYDTLDVKIASGSLLVPNIITPNHDGFNDTFVVTEGCNATTPWMLDIYTRWGRRVYHAEAYANDWNAPDLSSGQYYYWLHRAADNTQYKGWVEVVKK